MVRYARKRKRSAASAVYRVAKRRAAYSRYSSMRRKGIRARRPYSGWRRKRSYRMRKIDALNNEPRFYEINESTGLDSYGHDSASAVWSAIYPANDADMPYMDLPYAIAQGDDYTQRDGRRIYLRGVTIDGYLNGGKASGGGNAAIRLALVKVHDTSPFDPGDSTHFNLRSKLKDLYTAAPNIFIRRVFFDKKFTGYEPQIEGANIYTNKRRFRLYIPINEFVNFSGTAVDTQHFHYWLMACADTCDEGYEPGFVHTRFRVHFRDV